MKRATTFCLAIALAAPAFLVPAHADDLASTGEKAFKQNCSACHDAKEEKNKIGPYLKGVVGRTAGTAKGFHYSSAMEAAGKDGLVWTEENLTAYITDPKAKVPGNKMPYAGLKKPDEVAAIIAYLKTTGRSIPESMIARA